MLKMVGDNVEGAYFRYGHLLNIFLPTFGYKNDWEGGNLNIKVRKREVEGTEPAETKDSQEEHTFDTYSFKAKICTAI